MNPFDENARTRMGTVHNGEPLMRKTLTALLFLGAFLTAGTASAADAGTQANGKTATKKTAKKSTRKKAGAAAAAGAAAGAAASEAGAQGTDEDDREPETAGITGADYDCALGDKVTIFAKEDDIDHIALRWKTRLHRMTRVQTTTGAHRFENRRQGLVWIGIPAKGILLDSRKGQQLANECKTAEQMKPAAAAAAAGSSLQ
jgi:hypothetical protein